MNRTIQKNKADILFLQDEYLIYVYIEIELL